MEDGYRIHPGKEQVRFREPVFKQKQTTTYTSNHRMDRRVLLLLTELLRKPL
jgi:hypothetical protein